MSAPEFAWKGYSYPAWLGKALREEGCLVLPEDERLRSWRQIARASGPRIVHLHWLHPLCRGRPSVRPVLRSAAFLARLGRVLASGARVAWTAHNLHDHEAVRPRLDRLNRRFVSRAADAVIAHSDEARRIVTEHFALPPSRVTVIPHPGFVEVYPREMSRDEARKRLGIRAGEFVLLFLGMIRPYKGLDELFEALSQLDDQAIRLRVVGRVLHRRDLPPLRELAARDGRIELVPGFVPDEELQLHFRSADAVVLPYRDVLTSAAAVLAMSFGKVCVAPRLGCLVDVFAPGGVHHYEAGDAAGLADAIRRCVVARDSLAAAGVANLERAAGWTWRRAARETRSLYEALVGA